MIQDIPSLKEVYRDYFPIGAAVSADAVSKSPDKELIAKHFNVLTPENAMKFQPIHPEDGVYNFEHADRIVEFAQQNGMRVVGHTLIWHQQTPEWVFKDANGNLVSREVLLERMEEHIKTVVGHYRGKVYGWDVVNEAIADSPPYDLRDTMWRRIIGDDYIEWAFKFAHEADPEAELYYNDYNTETPGKREAIYNLVKGLKEKGIRIDAVGMQSHINIYYPSIQEVENSIKKFSSLGIKVNISELDMDLYKWGDREDRYRGGVSDDILQLQADRYGELFGLYRRYKDVIGRVTFWGYYDGGSWLNNFPVKGRTNYPLLFDRQFKPKPAFWSVVNFDL
ncbi:endo-1,4-beta-xylanase [Caldicoprobacter faecalis]|uniref:Beta-xylanase n=1 Tax=Caldicoprobacter faecalis TaxID=937334 RepID=A0A1I5W9P0_9FIRM|nr:endo-1,4-beta-xylanase [Caldicoprobacter faecalis]SFQ16409.1 endo-1,4-beta-xylanase [Caldicoprobacter faecalis]